MHACDDDMRVQPSVIELERIRLVGVLDGQLVPPEVGRTTVLRPRSASPKLNQVISRKVSALSRGNTVCSDKTSTRQSAAAMADSSAQFSSLSSAGFAVVLAEMTSQSAREYTTSSSSADTRGAGKGGVHGGTSGPAHVMSPSSAESWECVSK